MFCNRVVDPTVRELSSTCDSQAHSIRLSIVRVLYHIDNIRHDEISVVLSTIDNIRHDEIYFTLLLFAHDSASKVAVPVKKSKLAVRAPW